jgi:hypothetical protein
MPYGINKFVKRTGRYAKKRYVRKGQKTNVRNLNYSQIAKDVKMLKGLVNAEKQNADFSINTPTKFARVNGSGGSGAVILSIHPTVSQGITEDQRKGDTYKICSMLFQAQVRCTSNLADINYKIYICRKPTQVFSTSADLANLLEPNPFTGVQDFNSLRNYEQYRDFRVMKIITGKIRGAESDTNNVNVKQHVCPLKCDFHTRYDKGTTNIEHNELFAVFVADEKVNTGADAPTFELHNRIWFYDN